NRPYRVPAVRDAERRDSVDIRVLGRRHRPHWTGLVYRPRWKRRKRRDLRLRALRGRTTLELQPGTLLRVDRSLLLRTRGVEPRRDHRAGGGLVGVALDLTVRLAHGKWRGRRRWPGALLLRHVRQFVGNQRISH